MIAYSSAIGVAMCGIVAAQSTLLVTMPYANAIDSGSILAYDKSADLTTFILDLPYVHPFEPYPETLEPHATVTQGATTFEEHYTMHGTESRGNRLYAVDIAEKCHYKPEDKYGTCLGYEVTYYKDRDETSTSTDYSTNSEFKQHYVITITGGIEKLAATATDAQPAPTQSPKPSVGATAKSIASQSTGSQTDSGPKITGSPSGSIHSTNDEKGRSSSTTSTSNGSRVAQNTVLVITALALAAMQL